MNKFPRVTRKVRPLYHEANRLEEDLPDHCQTPSKKISHPHPNLAFNYKSSVKVFRSKMYEPVDRCITAVIQPPNFSLKNNNFHTTHTNNINDKNYENNTTIDLVPPEKPPRRNKLNRCLSQDKVVRRLSDCHNKMRNPVGDCGVDIDHINIETNNYKNRYQNTSVQTSPLIPYRLRFWPRNSCDVKCDPDENRCSTLRINCFCRILSQWILSQIGLTIVVIIWALLGAFAFYNTEGPRELEQAEHLAKLQDNLSIQLATVLRQTDEYKEQWYNTINEYMQKHESLLLEAVSAGFGEGGGGNIWTYPGCILFSVSLLTTLGFGAPVPRTSLGRGAAVLFSAIGIPLHFLLILNMGNLGAIKLQQLALRNDDSTEIPTMPRPKWLKLFPIFAILFYYLLGVILFGFVRERDVVDSLMFPLDFTAAGGVARTYGHVRICYALYLEVAVTLAAMVVSLIQASATRGIVDIGLRLGLLTNT